MIRYGYSPFSGSPAPFVHVTIRHPNTGQVSPELPAQIDTVADHTVIPGEIVDALCLTQSGAMFIAGFGSAIQS